MQRNGKMFAAGFRAATQPELVAETILQAIESETYQLRWPVGEDAKGLWEGRKAMSDEAFVAMGALSDDDTTRCISAFWNRAQMSPSIP